MFNTIFLYIVKHKVGRISKSDLIWDIVPFPHQGIRIRKQIYMARFNIVRISIVRFDIVRIDIVEKWKSWDFVPFPLLPVSREGIRRDPTGEQMSPPNPPWTKLRWKKLWWKNTQMEKTLIEKKTGEEMSPPNPPWTKLRWKKTPDR